MRTERYHLMDGRGRPSGSRGAMRAKALSLLVAVLSATLMTAPLRAAAAEDAPMARVVIVLDGSRFMAAPLEGRPKVEAERKAVMAVLPDYKDRVQLGVVAFGHRKAKSCSDIELLTPVGPLDPIALGEAMGPLASKGARTTSRALSVAADALAGSAGESHIVLITDGPESCRMDPCDMAAELTAANRNLHIHLIALAVPVEDRDGIACIAGKGNGTLLEAATQAELETALQGLLDRLAPGQGAGEKLALAAGPALWLSARLGSHAPSLTRDLVWHVTQDGKTIYAGTEAEPHLSVAAGSYHVEVTSGLVTKAADVVVDESKGTKTVLDLDAGVLHMKALADEAGTPLTDVFLTLYRVDAASGQALETITVSRDIPAATTLPAGTYRALLEHGLAKVERTFSIEPGAEIHDDVVIPVGEVMLTARAAGSDAILDKVVFTVSEDDPDAAGGERLVARSAASRASFVLRAGLYHVSARYGLAEQRTDISVRGGSKSEEVIEINAGLLRLSARMTGSSTPLQDGISFTVSALEPTPSVIAETARPAPEISVASGRYRVRCRIGPVNAALEQDVDVRPGQTLQINFELPAGFVRFQQAAAAGTGSETYWDLADANGAALWSSAQPEPRVALAAGDYRLTATRGGAGRTVAFTLAAGEDKVIEVPAP